MNKAALVTVASRDGSRSAEILYDCQPLPNRQARLAGRLVLKPQLDFKAYGTRAVIDWVDLIFRTGRPTQWKWVLHELEQAIGRRYFVWQSHIDDEAEYREFKVRFQDPDFQHLLMAERAIQDRWSLIERATVENLEISVDFRPKTPSEDALMRMFGVLVRSHLPGRDVISLRRDRPRVAWGKGKGNTAHVLVSPTAKPELNDYLLVSAANDRPAVVDSTYFVGAKGAASSWRIMIKIMDQQNKLTKTRLDLPESEKRVRIEVTIDWSELRRIGIVDLKSLQTFRFQTLQGSYFQFRLPTFADMTGIQADARTAISRVREERRRAKFLKSGVVGLEAMDKARQRRAAEATNASREQVDGPRAAKRLRVVGTLVVHKQLTDRVLMALRHLGARVRKSQS